MAHIKDPIDQSILSLDDTAQQSKGDQDTPPASAKMRRQKREQVKYSPHGGGCLMHYVWVV